MINMKDSRSDLRDILDTWKYEEGNNIRRIATPEGREVLQVRLPLGVEQYELDGRPDGLRPSEAESWYHHYRRQARETPWNFSLDEDSLDRLRQECMLYYHRYLLFFQISEYKLCARDTQRNLKVLDFASKYGNPTVAENLEQYRPYIIRMHVMAKALDRIQDEGEVSHAMSHLKQGMDAIEDLPLLEKNPIFQLEKTRSLRSLDDLYRQLENHLPKTRTDVLREELHNAITKENYEEAARIRDKLSDLAEEPKAE